MYNELSCIIDQSPFYLFNKDKFIKNVDELNAAFKKIYNNFQLAYSFKTNYATCICQTAKECGMYAEVVSPLELMHAVKLGFKNIIYNGVCKDEESLRYSVEHGVIINIDSLTDFNKLVSVIGNKKPKIGLRMNINIGNELNSRFGIVPYSHDYFEIIEKSNKLGIKISGIHCHVSEARDIKFWVRRCDRMFEVASEFKNLDYIDMGSNLYSKMVDNLRSQFGKYIPSYDDYADVIARRFKEKFADERVKLILETGTPVVSDTVDVVAKVVDIKEINGEKFAILNVCKFDVGTICIYRDAPIEVFNRTVGKKDYGVYKLTGYTCIEGDVLKESYEGRLSIGDVVIFKNAGSYSVSAERNFILTTIGMLQYSENTKPQYKVVKRRGSYNDVFDLFV